MKFQATISGLCPLLMHRFSEDELLTKTKKSGDKRLSDAEKKEVASRYLYLNNKKKLVTPAMHIEGAMQKAASQFKMAGAGKATYKNLVKGAVFIFPDLIVHKTQSWVVDARAVVNQTTQGRLMSYRPRLDTWSLDFEIEVNDDRADPDVIQQMLVYAGSYIGVGSYRPRFGRFQVDRFKRVK